MTIRKVVRLGHPALRVVASECTSAELQSSEIQRVRYSESDTASQIQRVIDDMIDTMRDYEGVGIAANQVGVPLRIFVMEVWSNNP
jgi:peptide deformylase